jgi:hypothetical protein
LVIARTVFIKIKEKIIFFLKIKKQQHSSCAITAILQEFYCFYPNATKKQRHANLRRDERPERATVSATCHFATHIQQQAGIY